MENQKENELIVTMYNNLHTSLRFVIAARSTEKKPFKGYGIKYLYIEGDTIVATDGRRLHWMQNPSILNYADGFYDVIKNTKSEIILTKIDDDDTKFPEYQDIIPKHKKYFHSNTDDIPQILMMLGGQGIAINQKHLEPLELFYNEKIEVWFDVSSKPILIKLTESICKTTAMVMSVTYKKPEIFTEN